MNELKDDFISINFIQILQIKRVKISLPITKMSIPEQCILKSQTFRCYLRTPDMKCKVEHVAFNQSVLQLKENVNRIFKMQLKSVEMLKLIINQTQLNNKSNLKEYLYQNAIIHVIRPVQEQIQGKYMENAQNYSQIITIYIKQPPIDCPINKIQKVHANCQITKLKQLILAYYQKEHELSKISSININQLYLVYCGRVMVDEKCLSEYGYQQNGIIYVVNGRQYVRELTREQVDRRVQEIRQAIPDISNFHQQKLQTISIIQNIVDLDDEFYESQEYQLNNNKQSNISSLAKSQKIIQRYNSIKKDYEHEQIHAQITKQNEQTNPTLQHEPMHENEAQNTTNQLNLTIQIPHLQTKQINLLD